MSRIAPGKLSKIPIVLTFISCCLTIGCSANNQPVIASVVQQGTVVLVTHDDAREPTGATAVAAGEGVYRWARRGPWRLYVQPSSELGGWSSRHLELVDEAVRAWTACKGVDITLVSLPRDADIRLYWTDRLPSTNPGVTMLYRNVSGGLARADVFVDVRPAPWHTGTPDRVLYATIAHEMGHALGLPHDPSPAALMHPSPLVTRVTVADRARLETLLSGR